jgi:hypothetical protein
MEGWIRGFPDEDRVALTDLATLLDRQREEARRALLTGLDSARYERLVAGFATMLRQGPSRRSAAARAPAGAVVPGLIAARHRSANKAARRAQRSGEADDFHATRIRVKRLRYALEFVSEIYDKRTARYVRHVVKLQDALGLMQDARVAGAKLHELATAEGSTLSPTTVFVMGGVTERYRHETDVLLHKVPGLLHELRGPEWRKLSALMERRRLELSAQYRWPGSATASPLVRAVPGPEPARPAPLPAGPPGDSPPLTTPILPASGLPAPDPTATHPAAGRPGPSRLVPSAWSGEPAPSPEVTPDPGTRSQGLGPSNNGGGPHPERP